MPFLQLSFELRGLDPETVESVCCGVGAIAVTLTDAADDAVLEPAPGELRLWPSTRVVALFPEGTDPTRAQAALSTVLGLPDERMQLESVADRPWEREWLKDFHPIRCGRRLWVCPSHATVDEPGAQVVHLDPGLAFGTGTHPSTALCLSWLDACLVPGTFVIDYGCGSGILALAAARLGAARVECYDIDPQAWIAARANAARNRLDLRVREQDRELTAGADVLLANILAAPLCTLASRFAQLVRPGGQVVLAGLMPEQSPEVTAAYGAWFDMRCYGTRDEWTVLTGTRRLSAAQSVASAEPIGDASRSD